MGNEEAGTIQGQMLPRSQAVCQAQYPVESASRKSTAGAEAVGAQHQGTDGRSASGHSDWKNITSNLIGEKLECKGGILAHSNRRN